jgi:hypothetical protein
MVRNQEPKLVVDKVTLDGHFLDSERNRDPLIRRLFGDAKAPGRERGEAGYVLPDQTNRIECHEST